MLGVLGSPVDGEPDFSCAGDLEKDLSADPASQTPWLDSVVMSEPRQSFDRCFLVAEGTGQLRLIAGLFFNDRDYKGGDRLDLMTMCPRQQISDIVKDAECVNNIETRYLKI